MKIGKKPTHSSEDNLVRSVSSLMAIMGASDLEGTPLLLCLSQGSKTKADDVNKALRTLLAPIMRTRIDHAWLRMLQVPIAAYIHA
jgi:hypothetical protein